MNLKIGTCYWTQFGSLYYIGYVLGTIRLSLCMSLCHWKILTINIKFNIPFYVGSLLNRINDHRTYHYQHINEEIMHTYGLQWNIVYLINKCWYYKTIGDKCNIYCEAGVFVILYNNFHGLNMVNSQVQEILFLFYWNNNVNYYNIPHVKFFEDMQSTL